MDSGNGMRSEAPQTFCPFLQSGTLTQRRGIPGYCTGRPDDELMVPSLFEYRTFCSTPNHTACPIYRYRRAPELLEGGRMRSGAP